MNHAIPPSYIPPNWQPSPHVAPYVPYHTPAATLPNTHLPASSPTYCLLPARRYLRPPYAQSLPNPSPSSYPHTVREKYVKFQTFSPVVLGNYFFKISGIGNIRLKILSHDSLGLSVVYGFCFYFGKFCEVVSLLRT